MYKSIDQPIVDSSLLAFWQTLSNALSIPFSANRVRHAMVDVRQHDGQICGCGLLVATGRRLGIRIRETVGSFTDLLDAVVEAGPVLVLREQQDGGDISQDADYFLILSRRRRGFEILVDGEQRIVSRRWVQRHSRKNADNGFTWYLFQPALSASATNVSEANAIDPDAPMLALRRFTGFLKPDAKDIRAIFVFSVIVGILSLTTPLAVEALVNTIAFGRYLQPLLILSLIMFVFLVFRAGLNVLMTVIVEIMQRRIFVRVVDDLSYHLTRVPLAHWKSHHGPEVVNRFFDVVNVQKVTARLLLESLMLILQTLIGMTVLAFYHPFLLGYDIALLVMMVIVMFVIGRGAVRTALAESKIKYKTAAALQELVRHPATFKFNGGRDFAVNQLDELATRYVKARRQHFRILFRQFSFSFLIQAVAATVLLGLGGYLVIKGQMTLGQLVAAELIVTVILGSFAKIGKHLESFYDLLASVDKLGQIYDLPVEPEVREASPVNSGPATVQLVDLKFSSYATPANVEVSAGGKLAISGRSGSGKSRLVELISGQISAAQGYVLLDDARTDLLDPDALQNRIALINDIGIFPGTIEDNLRMGRPEISAHHTAQVLQGLGLDHVVHALPDGTQTILSVSGHPLNSREAVFLVLARALLGKPGLILIDGLLDRLPDDDITELLERLNAFSTTSTLIIATGRQLITEWADQQLTVNEGQPARL